MNIFFDIESTGRNPHTCAITNIGAVAVAGCNESFTFDVLANPGVTIPDDVVKITNISNEAVANASPAKEAVRLFLRWIDVVRGDRDVTLIAYNGLRYDCPIIYRYVNDLFGPSKTAHAVLREHGVTHLCDPLPWLRKHAPKDALPRHSTGNCSYKLGDVYEAIVGRKIENAHTALPDAKALGVVYAHSWCKGIEKPSGETKHLIRVEELGHSKKRKMSLLEAAQQAKKAATGLLAVQK